MRKSWRLCFNFELAAGWDRLTASLGGNIKSVQSGMLVSPGRIEFYALCLLLFFLPYSEFFKHFFLAIFFLSWLARRYTCRGFGGHIDIADLAMMVIPVLGFLSAAFSPPNSLQIAINNIDLTVIMILGIMVKRTSWDPIQLRFLAIIITLGAFFALVAGFAKHKLLGAEFTLQSVGHINHSAIYLTLVALLAFVYFLEARSTKTRLVWILVSLCLFLAQLTFESKATTGTYIIFVVIFTVVIAFNRLKEVFRVVTLGLFSTLIIFYLSYPDLAKALVSFFNDPLAALGDRITIFNTGLVAGADSAFFGHGPGTFGAATSEENIRKILLGSDQVYESNLFTHRYQHAHSLYINYYVERGLFALILLIIFFGYCLYHSVKKLCESANSVAMTALSSTFFVLGIGLVNTTFHHEHGILSMLLIAPLLSQIRQ
jgi:O-antigen ligase